MTRSHYDFAVFGGGPAGSATALSLLARGARVLVIERCLAHRDRMGESLRGVARECLSELGVWEEFQRLEQRPSHYHRAAWGGVLEERHSIQLKYGPDLHLDRARFDALLLEAAQARGAEVLRPAILDAIQAERIGVRIRVTHPRGACDFSAARAVDATGRRASVARRLGARRRDFDRLLGVARTFVRGACEPSTLVEAAEDGWWYSAPQPKGRLVALFVTDAQSPARAARREDVWQRCLASAPLTRERLQGLAALGGPASYFAAPGLLEWDEQGPIIPVGDALLSFDPISADGLCFALRSGLEAADVLTGTRGSPSAYRAGARAVFHAHLARRELIYARERPSRQGTFWRRPRAPG